MEERITGRFEKARVKHVAVHKKEPLAIIGIYNGGYELWNTKSNSLIKSGTIGEVPIRACAFIEEQECFVLGSDDGMLRLFCLDTFELKEKIEAHNDFIRGIAVHPTYPYIATCSDDMSIKIWEYSKGLSLIRVLTGHTHYVMSICFSAKETRTILSCSMDHDIRMWNIESGSCIGVLSGPKSGLNAISLVSEKHAVCGGDDGKIYIWDITQQTLISTVSAHTGSVTAVSATPRGFLTAGEDGIIREWEKKRFRGEASISAQLQRVWTVTQSADGSVVAGGDDGVSFMKKGTSTTLFSFRGKEKSARAVICEDTTIKQVKSTNPSAHKILTTLSYVPDRISISTSERYLAVETDGIVHIYTLIGFLLQVSVPGHSLMWTGPEDFLLVYEGAIVQYVEFEVEGKIKMQRKERVESIAHIAEEKYLVSGEKEKYIGEIDSGVCKVVSSAEETIGAHIYKNILILILPNQVVISDGTKKISIECKVFSWCVKEDLLVVYNGTRVVYLVIPEGVPEKLFFMPLEIPFLGKICLMGVTDALWYIDGEKIKMQEINWELINFQRAVLGGAIPEKCPEELSRECLHFLIGMEMLKEAKRLSVDPDEKYELLMRIGELKDAIEIADSSAKFSALCLRFVEQGDLKNALVCAKKGNSVANEIILSSLCNETENLKKAAEKAAEEGETLLSLSAAYRTGNMQLCRDLLKGTPFFDIFVQNHK
ncbi:coatomer subunit beta' [Nematocida sp. LUAm3]|nr:coatomer subunit beta' [Nematocida sp. LUAm3]KAI5176176.1 coatomer subunit beta' [Nematocida sp. LUAm2]KAI5179270.1 coatomer subunit beta' [Nematocida sp. LUAm1]